MKRFITLLSGLLLAAVIGLAQGKWEQSSVTPYGTGGINRNGERIDNSYSSGKFNSEQKSTSKNNPYVYFRKGQFSVPGKTFRPGDTFTVNMNLTVKRHSGNGTPKGNAGAVIVNGKAGQGASVPNQVSISGKDAAKSGSATLTIPSHSAAGNNFSIVYSCFDIKVVYLYQWVEDKPVVTDKPAAKETTPAEAAEKETPAREDLIADPDPVLPETPAAQDEIVMPDGTILPPADTTAVIEYEPDDVDSLALLMAQGIDPFAETPLPEESPAEEKVKKNADSDVFLSILGWDLTKKDTIMYGIIAGLVLLVLILLLVLLFRKNPEKKAAKEAAKKAAAEAKAAAKAEAAEKAAAAKAAAAEKAAAMKAEREAKLAEQKAAQEAARAEAVEKAAAVKAASAEKAAAMKAEREAKLAEQKAAQATKQEELKAAREAKLAEAKAAQEARAAELKAKKETAAAVAAKAEPKPKPAPKPKPEEKPAEAPAAKRFCETCGAPLDPDAVFCENCGTKVE
ncbi:MAG: zinc ribbon domain-containing protein [Bacteroidota bacterium]|nr:zinc ribbon domain-containing protein [Bacteroidota bacterium]